MRYQLKCKVCGAACWARGYYEPDTNAGGIVDDDPLDDACEHVKVGGDYDLIDQEYDDCED